MLICSMRMVGGIEFNVSFLRCSLCVRRVTTLSIYFCVSDLVNGVFGSHDTVGFFTDF